MKIIKDEKREKKPSPLDLKNEEELLKNKTLRGQINYWKAKAEHYLTLVTKSARAIEAMNNRIVKMNKGEYTVSDGKKCLIIGRTIQDLYECWETKSESLHLPAPTTLMFTDFDKFEGDVISLHTRKPYTDYVVSMEFDAREEKLNAREDDRMILGVDGYQELFGGYEGELPNSGIYAIFWALQQGYSEIYTLGIDMINWWVSNKAGDHHHFGRAENPNEIDWNKLEEQVLNWPPSKYVSGYGRTPSHYKQALTIAGMAYRYPNQRVYKAHELSLLPVDVKIPPGVTQKVSKKKKVVK